jgi:hypothetical protein
MSWGSSTKGRLLGKVRSRRTIRQTRWHECDLATKGPPRLSIALLAVGMMVLAGCAVGLAAVAPKTGGEVSLTAATTYTVTFKETGLCSQCEWEVQFNGGGGTLTSSPTITFNNVASGTYPWSCGATGPAPSGFHWACAPASGQMNVPSQTQQSVVINEVRNP